MVPIIQESQLKISNHLNWGKLYIFHLSCVVVIIIVVCFIRKPHNPSPPPTDQGATYAAPESIKHETGPETGELYAVATKPSKKKKNKQPEENLPTYQVCHI